MKKIFSILTAILFVGSMMAAEVTVQKTMTEIVTANEYTVSAGSAVTCYTSFALDEKITVSTSGAANCGSFWGSTTQDWRLYQNKSGDITVTAAEGYTIKKLTITYNISSTGTLKDGTTTIASASEQTIDAQSKTYTVGNTGTATNGQVRVTQIKVIYEGGSEPTTQDLYLTLSSDWAGWTEKYSVYYFKDENDNGWSGFMTAVVGEENMYTTTIPAGYSKVIFVRNNSAATAPGWDSGDYSIVWSKTVDLTIPEGKNHFTVTSGGTGSECNGTWSKHVEPVIPAKFYITGDSALVTDAGAPGKAWNADAIKSETDTFTLKNLKAGQEYILKLTLNGTWEGENNVKGYNELTEKTPGLKDVSDDHNIGFKLNEAGDVQVIYNATTFKLVGNFYVPMPHYFIAGTMTNWKEEMVELLPLEEKADSLGVSLNLKADSLYLYKIVRVQDTDTAWYGLDGDATMTFGNSTDWYIYKSEGDKNQKNVGLQTTKEGDYPVTLVIKEDQLIVSVVIPKPDTKYYAKYADKAGEWNWKLLTEKEGNWLTDTIVYYGGGMNIHSAVEGDGKYFAEIAGVAAKDTAYFSFNPEDSTLVATVVGKYIKPFPVMQIAGQWDMEGENWIVNNMVLAADSLTATYEVSLEKGDYELKLIKDGKWITKANGGEPYGLHRTWPGVAGVVDEATENLKVTADVAGKYLFTWTFANDSIGITFPEKPEPKLENGYYLVGKFGGVDAWSVEDLSAAKLFAVNPENDKEYQLNITLAVEDSLKVVYVADDVITTWFPAEGDNYGVDANHAGATTIYFRPDYQGGEDWFAGCLYVVPTSTVDIEITNDGVQAIKVLRNGQILIIKGEKTYNALGILVE